jgi:D-lactate dehydrogenase (cytochrome)
MIIKTDLDLIKPYTLDSSNMSGVADKVIIPENIQELKDSLIECNKKNIPVTFSAAGTGLTGGKTPLEGIIISTEKFDQIINVDKVKKSITIEPGVIFSEMDKLLQENSLFYPPNPTETNSTLGGNVATNASGARTFKYGSTRDFVKRLKMILINGDEIEIKRGEIFPDKNGKINLVSDTNQKYVFDAYEIGMPAIKHAAGYFLKEDMDAIDLFIGSEGTLGFISEIELKLLERPENVLGGIVFFDDVNKLLVFINQLRSISIKNNKKRVNENNEIASRLIEYFDINSLNVLREQFPDIPNEAIAAVWFEQEYSERYEEELLEKWYAFITEYSSLVDDTWFATDEKMHEKLRDFRHQLPLNVYEKLTNNAYKKVGTDTAVPTHHFDALFNFIKVELEKSGLSHVIFGHVGNSHLHANLFVNNEDEYVHAMKIYDMIIDFSLKCKGTVSAEHGIGKIKKKYLHKMFGEKNINKMKTIKSVFDPAFIVNRGNLF